MRMGKTSANNIEIRWKNCKVSQRHSTSDLASHKVVKPQSRSQNSLQRRTELAKSVEECCSNMFTTTASPLACSGKKLSARLSITIHVASFGRIFFWGCRRATSSHHCSAPLETDYFVERSSAILAHAACARCVVECRYVLAQRIEPSPAYFGRSERTMRKN